MSSEPKLRCKTHLCHDDAEYYLMVIDFNKKMYITYYCDYHKYNYQYLVKMQNAKILTKKQVLKYLVMM